MLPLRLAAQALLAQLAIAVQQLRQAQFRRVGRQADAVRGVGEFGVEVDVDFLIALRVRVVVREGEIDAVLFFDAF